MHDLLILYFLTKSQNTMYGLSKMITKYFGYLLSPSFGTLQPALKRMLKKEYVTLSEFYTTGGKPSFYYSITDSGQKFLKKKLLDKPTKNPVQFFPEIKIKIACSDILEKTDKKTMFMTIKSELLKIKIQSEKILSSEIYTENYCGKMILDDTVCGYKNLYELIERLEIHACKD